MQTMPLYHQVTLSNAETSTAIHCTMNDMVKTKTTADSITLKWHSIFNIMRPSVHNNGN